MSAAKLAPTPQNIGELLARNMFKSRGDNFEVHLLERDLALLIKGGAEIAIEGVSTANVEALNKTRDTLVYHLADMIALIRHHMPMSIEFAAVEQAEAALKAAKGEAS